MLRTVSIKLCTTAEQADSLLALQAAYADACNALVPVVIENRCWNRVALHKLSYYGIRANSPLGAQMVCNAIFSVCKAYKAQVALKRIGKETVPKVCFEKPSVHFDKRTYSIKKEVVSLYTLNGRIKVPMILGEFQRRHLASGVPKEAELINKKGTWFFNLVLETETPKIETSGPALGVDIGETISLPPAPANSSAADRFAIDAIGIWICANVFSPTVLPAASSCCAKSPAKKRGA